MKGLVEIVAQNVKETFRAADQAEKRGRVHLARALRAEARELAFRHGIKTALLDGAREKDNRRQAWERKKGNKVKFWRDRGEP